MILFICKTPCISFKAQVIRTRKLSQNEPQLWSVDPLEDFLDAVEDNDRPKSNTWSVEEELK